MKRGSLSRKYCTEFLPLFPWECKGDQVLEPVFIQTSVGMGRGAKSECDKTPPTQLIPAMQSRQSSGASKHCRRSLQVIICFLLLCTVLTLQQWWTGTVSQDWHHALRNTSSLISCFCPRKISDDWSYFSPEECCSWSLHLPWHFPPLHLWLIRRLKPK